MPHCWKSHVTAQIICYKWFAIKLSLSTGTTRIHRSDYRQYHNQPTVMCTTRGERRLISNWCKKECQIELTDGLTQ